MPNGSGDIGLFGAFTGPVLEVAIEVAPVTVGEILFLGPGQVTIQGAQDLILAAGPQTEFPIIFVDGLAPTPTILATLAGNNGLEKLGAGSLLLDSPLNYVGPTVVSEGSLLVGAGSTLQNGPLFVRDGAALDVTRHGSYSLAPGQPLLGRHYARCAARQRRL